MKGGKLKNKIMFTGANPIKNFQRKKIKFGLKFILSHYVIYIIYKYYNLNDINIPANTLGQVQSIQVITYFIGLDLGHMEVSFYNQITSVFEKKGIYQLRKNVGK